MVHIFTEYFLFAALVVTSFAVPTKRTVAQVEADIASISSQVATLDKAVHAFPDTGGSLALALAIHTDATNLGSSLTDATNDVKDTGALSESDGRTIIASVQAFEPTYIDVLNALVRKKPAFQAFPIGGVPALIQQDISTLHTDTDAFMDAIINAFPADLQAEANTDKTAIDAAFSKATAAYA